MKLSRQREGIGLGMRGNGYICFMTYLESMPTAKPTLFTGI